jgi:NADH-quinone oxidoreductase subunit E
MAPRQFAPPEQQPQEFSFTQDNLAWAKMQIGLYPKGREASAIIPLLWRAQEQAGGWLPRRAIEYVAHLLNIPIIRACEVATFYSMFNLAPVGRYFVQLCGTTPCALRGAEGLKTVLENFIGPSHHITSDGLFSWAEVECLGTCCNAPVVQINTDIYEDLTEKTLHKLLLDLKEGRFVKPGSQSGRCGAEPKAGVTTLTDPTLYDESTLGLWRNRFSPKN